MKLEDIKVGKKYKIVKGMEHCCGNYRNFGGTHIKVTGNDGDLNYEIYAGGISKSFCYRCFKPEHLLPMTPTTFQELQVGDKVSTASGGEHTVLARLNDVVLLSDDDEPEVSGDWYHVEELEGCGYELPDTPDEEMLEIEGTKYTVSEIKKALGK